MNYIFYFNTNYHKLSIKTFYLRVIYDNLRSRKKEIYVQEKTKNHVLMSLYQTIKRGKAE